jgi:putative sterol carrier protein
MSQHPAAQPHAVAEWLRRHFRPEAARGVIAVIEIELTGPDGGSVCVQIEDGRIKTSVGGDAAPGLRLVVDARDWSDVMAGRANAEFLAVEGRIRIEGDPGLAMKMRSCFRRSA